MSLEMSKHLTVEPFNCLENPKQIVKASFGAMFGVLYGCYILTEIRQALLKVAHRGGERGRNRPLATTNFFEPRCSYNVLLVPSLVVLDAMYCDGCYST